jgi:glutathione peroxidase
MRTTIMNKIYTSALKRVTLTFGILASSILPNTVGAGGIEYYTFPSIYGGSIDTKKWQGKPYLVVNTASQCAFTKQYASLQKLYDKYRDAGFGMVAVPSDDFNQELDSDAEVKRFCELNYDIDMPMSETLSVRDQDAHPFFKAVKAQSGFVPKWNFNKILISGDGQVIDTWGSLTRPLAAKLTSAIEDELLKSQ